MDPLHSYGNSVLIKFLSSRKKTIRVSLEEDPEVCLFYGPSWVPVWFYVMKFLSNSKKQDATTLKKTMSGSVFFNSEEDVATLKKTMSDIVGSDIVGLYHSDLLDSYKGDKQGRVQFVRMFLHDFMPRVQKFFKVPTKMSYCEVGTSSVPLNQNEVLSAFMDFLLQIWNSEANRDDDEDDDEDDSFSTIHKKENFGLVHKWLKYLLAYLGDVPFQCCPPQLKDILNTLLAQFERLANHVGYFTFYYILSRHRNNLIGFDAYLDALLQIIELLDEHITLYCIAFSKLVTTTVTISNQRVTRPIDLLFIVDSLLTDLQSLITQRFKITVDVDIDIDMENQIGILFEELKLSKIFLKNVKLVSRGTVNDCFVAIRDIAYEAEYIINSYVVGSIPVWYLRLRLPAVVQKLKLNHSRLQKIKSDCDVLQVIEDFTRKVSLGPRETSIAVVEDHLVGIEETKINILDKLTGGSKSLQIISLVGMPGLGKTTLAKNLFDNFSDKTHFDRRAWCVISQTYEKKRVFVEILTTLKIEDTKEKLLKLTSEELGFRIHQSLMGNRYVIIIDDIWVSQTWDDIRIYFPDDNNGSRIMLTSRNKDATPSESIFPELPLLSQVDSMNLLVKKVFLNGHCPPQLLAIGKKIAKGCNGLPLAVVAIAGILANLDQEERVWENVERDLCKFILDSQGDCMKVLEFSYEYLPDHLKMCFLYLGKFPENTRINVQNVLRLWVAEGFIEKVKENHPEDVAKEYLHDLINRSLVSVVAKSKFDGSIKTCGLHDLLRKLCRQKADEENFIKSTEEPFSMYMRHHLVRVDCRLSSHFGQHRRSFSGPLFAESYSFPQMPLHRVIDVSDPDLRAIYVSDTELGGIDMLVHLRYLCAPQHKLSRQSVRNLVNLEFLDVSCFSGDEIALSTILKMVKLKHLKSRGYTEIIHDCSNRQITNLQSFSGFVIKNLEDDKFLKFCPHLQNLKCWSYKHFPDVSSCTKLETLTLVIHDYRGIDFEKIMLPISIRKLNLRSYFPWDAMSKIGELPNLQELNLWINQNFGGAEWETSNDEFQELRFLKLDGINTLKRWITCSEHFPKLKCLVLNNCENLQDISSDLGDISTLQTIEVYKSSYTVSKSAVQIEIEQHDEMGNKEFQVKIFNENWSKENLMQEYRKLKETFSLSIENDGYNITSANELGAAIRSVTGGHCPSEAELQSMINEIHGSIDFPNFVDLIVKMRVPYSEHELQKAYQFFSTTWRYTIDSVDLNSGLTKLGQEVTREEAEKMVREADTDGDGKLNYDEFKKLMMTIDVPKPYDLRTALLMSKRSDGDGKLNYDEFKKLMMTIDVPKPYDLRTALLMAKSSKVENYDDVDDYDNDVTAYVPMTTHFSHPHPLQPILRDQIPEITPRCSGCLHRSSATMYTCQLCNFILHPSCAKLPKLITLDSDHKCTLSLLFVSSYHSGIFSCVICRCLGFGWGYNCKHCEYDLHVSCASKRLKYKYRTSKLDDAIFKELLRHELGTNLKFEIQTDQGRGFRINSDHLIRRKNRRARIQSNPTKLNKPVEVEIGSSLSNVLFESHQLGGETDSISTLANKIDTLDLTEIATDNPEDQDPMSLPTFVFKASKCTQNLLCRVRRVKQMPKTQLNGTNYVQIGSSSLNDVAESEQLGATDESTALANKIDML